MRTPFVPFLDRPGAEAIRRVDGYSSVNHALYRMAVLIRRRGGPSRSPWRHRKEGRA